MPEIKIITWIFLISFVPIFIVHAQDKGLDNPSFEISIQNTCKASGHVKLFHASVSFFLEDEIDSTYIYVSKYLLSNEDKHLMDYAYYLQGSCAVKKKLWTQARESFDKVSDTFLFNHLKNLSIANIHLYQKEYKEALVYYKEWESVQFEKDEDINTKEIYHNMGLCYLHLSDHSEATKYLFKERDLAIKDKDTLSIIYATMDIANVYYEQYLDSKAIPLFEEAYTLSKTTSDFKIKESAALNMAVVEENKKNFKESIRYRKEYEKWKDSIWNRDKIWESAQLEKKLTVAQKEKEIELQEKQIDVQNARQNLLFIGIVSLLMIIGIIAFFLRHRIQKNKIITSQKDELSNLNEMKNKLFSIVSHDLRTPVNSIRSNNVLLKEAIENDDKIQLSDRIDENIQVADGVHLLLDKVLNWSLLESGQLFTNMESFLLKPIIAQIIYDYESILVSKNIQINNNTPSSIVVYADIESIKVVLRNLLDNAIKYSHTNGSIIFQTSIKEGKVCHLEIIDNGIGITKEKLKMITSGANTKMDSQTAVSGFGLRLCKSLLQNNGGDLIISSKEGNGTNITVTLPVKEA
ncbi:tetratricopeptide repeat-containing sensor histidine kinase [Aquimarina sp. 2201CG14-23]|uniref:tetratricopeptide repeat-containing sensor histidine kinase n=1 Tax=Aquimarina mycalae TaxID=3040073 RepID=UPI0024781F73|nr:tetratricopeptide repeat-containing sensor histidine kinase [Aquimarina sp. 2201CG14-23]MDH7447653.1 tetratricopeptide repeat-containing sensor histidine kinase [Aquimarina sp. 2201CG14-23]